MNTHDMFVLVFTTQLTLMGPFSVNFCFIKHLKGQGKIPTTLVFSEVPLLTGTSLLCSRLLSFKMSQTQ